MKLSKELIEKAKTAKTAEELIEMARSENMDMTAEEAAKAFAELHKTGELSDDELDNVSGGCHNPSRLGLADSPGAVCPRFNVGDLVEVYQKYGTDRARVVKVEVVPYQDRYAPLYTVRYVDDNDNSKFISEYEFQHYEDDIEW